VKNPQKKRKRRTDLTFTSIMKRFWKRNIASKLAVLLGVIANLVVILGFFGISTTDNKNLTIQAPVSLSYVLYENLPDLTWSSALYGQGLEAYNRNEYDVALEKFDKALKEYENFSHADVDTAKIQYAIGIVYKRKGNLDRAIDWYSDAIGTLESLPNVDTEEVCAELAYVHYLRGFLYLETYNLTRALIDCDECINLRLSIVGEGLSFISAPLNLRGMIYTSSFYGTHSPYLVHDRIDLEVTWLDAMTCFETALQYNGARLKQYISDFDPENEIIVDAYNDYGYSQVSEFLWGDISHVKQKAHYVIQRWDAETAYILTNRARLLFMRGTLDSINDAIENCNAALHIYDDLPIDKRDGIQETYWLLAQAKLMKCAIEDSKLSEDVIGICVQIMSDSLLYTKEWYGESYETAIAHENMGFVLMFSSRYDEAAENFKEAQRLFNKQSLREDAEKQNDYLDIVKKCAEDGDTLELQLVDGYGRVQVIPS